MDLQMILMAVAITCITLAVAGGGFVALREAGARSKRDQRLSGNIAPSPTSDGPKTDSGLIKSVKRIGDQMAQDPAQLNLIRQRLIHAGYFNREAVALYLGARAVCLGLAILA